MKKQQPISLLALLLTGMILFGTACTKTSHYEGPPVVAVPAATGFKLTANAKFGNILTDNNGFSLYFFANDANGTSACAGGCTVLWIPFYKENPTIGTGLNAADFGVITRADNTKQTTYKGWPLYHYQSDLYAGDTNGDGVAGFWFIAKADYTVMLANVQFVGNDGVQYTSLYKPGVEVTQYITDDYGRTVYSFTNDKAKKNNFTKADFSNNANFPIDTVKAVNSVPSVLDKTQFDIINVFGKTQLVYKGWPLYYYGNDKATRGSTKGVSVPTPGFWPTANKNINAAPAQ